MIDDVEAARRQWLDAGLPFPRVPAGLVDSFHRTGGWSFATDDDLPDPYQFGAHVRRISSPTTEPFALLAHAGHGLVSRAMHWYVCTGPLVVMVQSQWGGAAGDMKGEAALLDAMRRRFEGADALVELVGAATSASTQGARLVVLASDFDGSRWVVQPADGEPEPHVEDDPFPGALAWLARQ